MLAELAGCGYLAGWFSLVTGPVVAPLLAAATSTATILVCAQVTATVIARRREWAL
ncbi:MAG: hypothetical protein KDI19_01585 [Pseudomonadales bacterium]|nr:hypothetical protein [Pseudomonadales bacterium]